MVGVLDPSVRKDYLGSVCGYLRVHHAGSRAPETGVRPFDEIGAHDPNSLWVHAKPAGQIRSGLVHEGPQSGIHCGFSWG
jgi:hypothetical protein